MDAYGNSAGCGLHDCAIMNRPSGNHRLDHLACRRTDVCQQQHGVRLLVFSASAESPARNITSALWGQSGSRGRSQARRHRLDGRPNVRNDEGGVQSEASKMSEGSGRRSTGTGHEMVGMQEWQRWSPHVCDGQTVVDNNAAPGTGIWYKLTWR